MTRSIGGVVRGLLLAALPSCTCTLWTPPDPDDDTCVPDTCAAVAGRCGALPDGCGGRLECGGCAAGQTCGAGGPNVCAVGTCTPTTCAAQGKNCGDLSDGCADVLACGSCTSPEFCGGAGQKNVCGQDSLASRTGCGGVFNHAQVLDLHLTMSAGDWDAIRNGASNTTFFPAQFHCGTEPALPFQVGVRHKRSGSTGKPGLKLDFNFYQAGADWQTLKKLSLENGVSEGSASPEVAALIKEYAAWRLMVRSGAHSSRAAFARLHVNGAQVGVYVNVEQVDRRFLRSRLGDDTGWLYKHSGSTGDGYKTNSTQANPYAQALCFLGRVPNGCTRPSDAELLTYLPQHLDIPQMLRFGGVNALISNTDAPLGKDNNYYWYDWGQPRLYLAWDLDTVMRDTSPLFGGSGSTVYTSVLFTHWEDDYDRLLTGLLEDPLTLNAIHAELDQVVAVAGPALSGDPTLAGQDPGDAVGQLKSWWTTRHAQVTTELQNHLP